MSVVELGRLAKVAAGESVALLPVIEKEILHYSILSVMSHKGYLSHLTFQGGTSLRLCYNSDRLSEDLDFTGGLDFKQETMLDLKSDIESALQSKYGLSVSVKSPKEVRSNEGIQVSAWQVSVETHPEDRSLPRQRVKVEVANVPSYTREARTIRNNYPDIPTDSVIVQVQSQEEIMADKILAFPVSANIRYRDIWDLAFMSGRGVRFDSDLLKKKIGDYGIFGYERSLSERTESLNSIIESEAFRTQISRFLPASRLEDFDLRKESMFHAVNDLLSEARRAIAAPRRT